MNTEDNHDIAEKMRMLKKLTIQSESADFCIQQKEQKPNDTLIDVKAVVKAHSSARNNADDNILGIDTIGSLSRIIIDVIRTCVAEWFKNNPTVIKDIVMMQAKNITEQMIDAEICRAVNESVAKEVSRILEKWEK